MGMGGLEKIASNLIRRLILVSDPLLLVLVSVLGEHACCKCVFLLIGFGPCVLWCYCMFLHLFVP